MELDLLKLLIQSACSNGDLSSEKRLHLEKKATDLGINKKDLDFLIINELSKQQEKAGNSNESGFVTTNNKSGQSGFTKKTSNDKTIIESGFSTSNNFDDYKKQQTGFTNISTLHTSGSMSRILKAQYYGKWVVIKKIKEQYVQNEKYKELFYKEFHTSFDLDHPNIVRLFGKSDDDNDPYFFMEYIDGRTLTQIIGQDGIKDGNLIKKIATEILQALEYIHKKQVYHRDLKPDNVLITYKGDNVKLIDFGLAGADHFNDDLEKVGTPKYAAPEQQDASLSKSIDGRADIYAFGLMLLEMLTGQTENLQLANQRSPKLFELLKQCTQKNISERASDVVQLIYEIKNVTIVNLKFELKASKQKIDFGKITLNAAKSEDLKLINRGIGKLRWTIHKKPEWINIDKRTNNLQLKLKTDKKGIFSDELIIDSNGGKLKIPITAEIVEKPEIKISNEKIDWKQINLDEKRTQEIIIKNIGSGELNCKITSAPKWLNLSQKENKLILTFDPKSAGTFSDTIVIESNGGNVKIPVKVTVKDNTQPIIDVSPSQIHFNNIKLNDKKDALVEVRNTGTGKLKWEILQKPGWVKLEQLSEHLNINLKTNKAGQLVDNIKLKSNGGSATITVSAEIIDPKRIEKQKRKKAVAFSFLILLILTGFVFLTMNNYESKKKADLSDFYKTQVANKDDKETTTNGNKNKIENLTSENTDANTNNIENANVATEKKDTISDEEKLWNTSKRLNSLVSYETYLKKYPKGIYAEECMEILQNEPFLWEKIIQTDTKSAYYKYIRNFPAGIHINKAKFLYSLCDTTIYYSFKDQANYQLQEDIKITIEAQKVKGRLIGSDFTDNKGWIADLHGKRINDTLILKHKFFSDKVTTEKYLIRSEHLIKLNDTLERIFLPQRNL